MCVHHMRLKKDFQAEIKFEYYASLRIWILEAIIKNLIDGHM